MVGLQMETKIRSLLKKVMDQSVDLTDGRDEQVVGSIERVQTLLDSHAEERNQILLLLSAALQHMRRVERLALEGMRMDHWITLKEEAVLVHIRLICAEVIALLGNASDEMRLAPIPIRR